MALHTIELCSGVGMLGEGLRAGLAYLGLENRTCVHVEREAYAAAVLVARMEEGSLDAAPVWPDLCTFDARAWRGKVDCVVAGFPCQDLSVAGRRAGLDGKRSGLFFEVVRIATDSGARLMFLENVAGIASATAAALDEAEGELEERAAARVVGELADLGWDSEWITLSASDVGASHGRARWFCLAWRELALASRHGRHQGRPESGREQGRLDADERGVPVADADSSGLRASGERECRAFHAASGGVGLFAPGPADPRWAGIIADYPYLAPALEPAFRCVVNGLAFDMGDCRAARLKCAGNGVVALQAAAAFVVLARRAGLV
jgi:site-specific DNA-cytosine methylase